MTDILVTNHGTIFIVIGISAAGKAWLNEHMPEDAQRWGSGYVVEHRYIRDIVDGAQNDGLTVS